ncbi:Alpha-D-kanosaminyltransferase [Stieleria maiorica]|uniref:Alpha-D-kanosaminyltransferase n=1 Tax=Stieleria maiorica TaxID=2795974 RepID=A0A5B9MF68_9BACT|nr:glycosyltransferase family 4 protein [Stieleria maiorica]QEF99473.1 Alpha-D-kanosaminyltransferase [Stieleria maiorica]
MKLAFLTTHPIQYQVPVFRHLAAEDGVQFTAVFCTIPTAAQQGAEFGVDFQWDIPLLEGYRYHVLENVSKSPGLMHFNGCDTPGVTKYFFDQGFDAVVINGWVVKSCLQAARACKRLGISCIVRGEANHLRPRAWWKRLIHRRLMRFYDAYCPIGKASAAFYRQLGVPDERMFLAPYCIENDRIAATSPRDGDSIAAARRRFEIHPDQCCFLFCGKLIEKKQPVGLLKAIALANQQGAQFQVLVVGDGAQRDQCERLAREENLPVRFPGFLNQSEIGQAYSAADALVLPSDNGETWGLVVNEAFAAGLPALVSDQVGCHPDLIHEGETGWVHPFGDWQTLADQMRRAAGDRSRLTQMGHNAKALIRHYSPRDAADGILRAARYATGDRVCDPGQGLR